MPSYYTNAPEVQEIARVAFPDYNGRKFSVAPFQGPMNLASNWDGGSKMYYALVNLRTMRTAEVPESGTMHTGGAYRITTLPPNMAVVAHSIFMGKDSGITIYVNQENLTKLLPKPDEVSWAEKVVLSATRSLKSSYAGIKDYRFREALKDTGITKQEWDAAKESLVQKKMLNAAGAITNDGKNAIGWTNLSQLKREKKTEPEKLPEPEKGDEALPVEISENSINTDWMVGIPAEALKFEIDGNKKEFIQSIIDDRTSSDVLVILFNRHGPNIGTENETREDNEEILKSFFSIVKRKYELLKVLQLLKNIDASQLNYAMSKWPIETRIKSIAQLLNLPEDNSNVRLIYRYGRAATVGRRSGKVNVIRGIKKEADVLDMINVREWAPKIPTIAMNFFYDEAPPVEISEKSETCWKCPHCKQEIYEKHSYPVDPYDVECNEEIHSDCGGKFKRPPMDEETKNWLKNFLRY